MIELRNIYKSYRIPGGSKTALENINMLVGAGDYIVISGANGCGKTTLLNIIAGMQLPSSGIYIYNGVELEKASKYLLRFRRENIGYVSQRNYFIETDSTYSNIVLPLTLQNVDVCTNAVNKLAERLSLNELLDKKIGTLSVGERQKVSVIRALITNPKLLLLDEPTSALDNVSQKTLINLLAEYNDNGGTIIVATHDDELRKAGKHQYQMVNGVLKTFNNS